MPNNTGTGRIAEHDAGSLSGKIAALWGMAGFFFLLGNAIVHLAAISLQALQLTLSPLQWLALLLNIIFMAYSEGYKGFQQNYAPRFAARVKYLTTHATAVEKIMAPLFCMNFFNASKKRLIVSYTLLLFILVFIFVFRMLPQPWRGVLDAGVVVGLVWGLLSTIWFCTRALCDHSYAVDPELASPLQTTESR